jgi:hypothetical protein
MQQGTGNRSRRQVCEYMTRSQNQWQSATPSRPPRIAVQKRGNLRTRLFSATCGPASALSSSRIFASSIVVLNFAPRPGFQRCYHKRRSDLRKLGCRQHTTRARWAKNLKCNMISTSFFSFLRPVFPGFPGGGLGGGLGRPYGAWGMRVCVHVGTYAHGDWRERRLLGACW